MRISDESFFASVSRPREKEEKVSFMEISKLSPVGEAPEKDRPVPAEPVVLQHAFICYICN
jgi:hypothetical protein